MASTFFQIGQQGYTGGAIADQTLLLQDIRDGLAVYNDAVDPVVELFSEETIRQTLRVSQAPKVFGRAADGGNPESQKMVYRLLNAPLNDYDMSSEFTVKWLQDALSSDVVNEVNGSMKADVEKVQSLFWQSVFLKQTAGSIGTAYQASFYNGETDVPPYRNNTFTSAHYHYAGINTTTLSLAIWAGIKHDIQEHGYGLGDGSLHAWFNTNDASNVTSNLVNTNASSSILQAITAMRGKAIDQGIINNGFMIDGVVCHFDDHIPSGYFCMLATDVKPVVKRVHFRPEYAGLMTYRGSNASMDYPLSGMIFLRRIGFAVQFLGAGTVRQIVASTSYTNPTFRLAA